MAWAAFCRATLWLVVLLLGQPASAHLVLAQQATVNIVGNQAYVSLSLPVSVFHGVDDDGDARWSAVEIDAHRGAIEAQWQAGLQILSSGRATPQDHLVVRLAEPDQQPEVAAATVLMLASYTLPEPPSQLELQFQLWGTQADLQHLNVVVQRSEEKQLLRLRPERPRHVLLPSIWVVFVDFLQLGAQHILSGADHLLFLWVVIAVGWRVPQLILALTCFTLGHAITLAACLLGGVSVSPALVEPAIAATIIGMAGLDLLGVQRNQSMAVRTRFALVFVCALIHGLGFADVLKSVGLDSRHQLVSLAGFNLGIECAQVAVAGCATTLLGATRRLPRFLRRKTFSKFAPIAAIGIGGLWLVQRLVTAF